MYSTIPNDESALGGIIFKLGNYLHQHSTAVGNQTRRYDQFTVFESEPAVDIISEDEFKYYTRVLENLDCDLADDEIHRQQLNPPAFNIRFNLELHRAKHENPWIDKRNWSITRLITYAEGDYILARRCIYFILRG